MELKTQKLIILIY